ncbi:MAG: CDP-diacylglycerol--glycerol-3-phosphate 3-phosphatidyltransferase [Liquorilactobacillus nagelii]|jgi:CDP-diacylglycerol--glycerol-3-phosphate 3-phosphatidyltransferase|uniref:CDP-diacylglycerol--glycerol-3-phosphate 3-phosphatidyltransferase n=1 Tax=Liquorilactobacillus nagelii TaxID=82688 RepID=A0A3S6QTY1_9LACO|nr:CDP-diacylglycerol--glycerol-3-phosphate 3-phosphatidyltransferase [Liquorilactobacillus nagelii]AUJ31592.1 CDP-diacylglycerol--glycerol-3-phosphate 3-phosphatidyltransferase [Liquorilactobacillus nagelii]MCC7616047.1 CDP-diacylglycerol--glycerol-3-phosphate 3-phosphatidyltransferase [Liquorilactobacillus nagelii]MCI1633209.1 CDP-diacylglycerol--glycerol-3-phosphate 3-phosphatidyltransferase [Liquorilactobacillus nagelii]MCI1699589.1 CDP-diacylglycerol--glycerol-3-phosphate 3-phosphatidyltra
MNLPNKLTVLRIFLIPVFMVVLLAPLNWGSITTGGTVVPWTQVVGAIIFAVASITDFADGQIARRQHLVTNFGKFADPLADKMLVMTAFIILVSLGKVPAWVAAIIVCRELAVTGLRLIVVENDGEVIAAAMPGKIKTMTQMLSIIFLFLNDVFFAAVNIPIGEILLYICLFFTVYSGIDYFVNSRSVFADSFEK